MKILRSRQRGLSIIELMVSVAISVAVLSALSYVYVGSRGAYRTNEALARVQETGRFALEWIARDLRAAGFMGCLSRGVVPVFYSNPKPATLPSNRTLFGYEDGAGFVTSGYKPTSLTYVRGDVVLIQAIDFTPRALVVEDTDVVNANIRVDNNPGFEPDEFLIVTDCERAAVFTLTNTFPANTLTHGGNSNGGLETSNHLINPPFRASSRAFVARFSASPKGYFIGRNRAGRPSLYRMTGAGAGAAAEEVVENVEDLDFLYGVDTNNDGSVDAYMKADGMTEAQWDQVLSVRVSLVVMSSEALAETRGQAVSAAIAGGQVVYVRDEDGDSVADAQPANVSAARRDANSERSLRQVFTTTVALRNRLP
jgi:type IV pilus assembly protein PilW